MGLAQPTAYTQFCGCCGFCVVSRLPVMRRPFRTRHALILCPPVGASESPAFRTMRRRHQVVRILVRKVHLHNLGRRVHNASTGSVQWRIVAILCLHALPHHEFDSCFPLSCNLDTFAWKSNWSVQCRHPVCRLLRGRCVSLWNTLRLRQIFACTGCGRMLRLPFVGLRVQDVSASSLVFKMCIGCRSLRLFDTSAFNWWGFAVCEPVCCQGFDSSVHFVCAFSAGIMRWHMSWVAGFMKECCVFHLLVPLLGIPRPPRDECTNVLKAWRQGPSLC